MYKIIKRKEKYTNYDLIDTEASTSCTITPEKGGMCTSFVVDKEENIYINEENYASDIRTRCAIPVLFPTTGLCEQDLLNIDGNAYPMGIHGIAHAQPWEVVSTDTATKASITIRLRANEFTLRSYPYHFQYDLTYSLKAGTLTLDIKINNEENRDMLFSFGFHPYFKVSHINNLTFAIDAEQIQYADGVFKQCDDIKFPYAKETKVTLAHVSSPCTCIDQASGKRITIHFGHDIPYVILWSLCEQNFLCMEPWNTLPNALNKGQGELIQAHGEYKTRIQISVRK